MKAHAAELRDAGVPPDARVFALRGLALWAVLARDGALMLIGGVVGLAGFLHHVVPYGIVRLIVGRTAGTGKMVVALHRLLLSLPGVRGVVCFRVVADAAVLRAVGGMDVDGVDAVCRDWPRLRCDGGCAMMLPFWWAEVRLMFSRRAAKLFGRSTRVSARCWSHLPPRRNSRRRSPWNRRPASFIGRRSGLLRRSAAACWRP